jgi:hypothetical protein
MPARIYKPAKTAMQSGQGRTERWLLEFEPEKPKSIEPLMGYTSSGDMRQQVRLSFDTREEAIAYAMREGLAYQLIEPKKRTPQKLSYSDNFKFAKAETWTH